METRLPQKSDSSDITAIPPGLLQELVRALESIRFGSIELVIHDGRVVQLEKREKLRLSVGVMEEPKDRQANAAAPAPQTMTGRPDYRKPATSNKQEIDV
jgi:hypothetical protein